MAAPSVQTEPALQPADLDPKQQAAGHEQVGNDGGVGGNNNNTCGNYSLVDCGAALQAKVKAVDAQVKSLAPVINSQPYTWIFGPKLETSLKVKDGSAYIFAMTDGSTGARTFTLPPGVTGNVEVVGEGRTIAVANGTFTDSFASEFTHHIYRIALG